MLKYIALFVTLAVVNNMIAFSSGTPQAIYFGAIAFAGIFGFFTRFLKINGYVIFIIFAALLSILLNEIPGFYKSPQRLLTFCIGLFLVSPAITTTGLIRIRLYIFRFINIALIAIVVLSILGKFSGIYPGVGPSLIFQGITVHSMMLGPISAVVLLISIYGFIKNRSQILVRYFFIVSFVFAFVALLLASSRVAVMGAGFSLLLFLYQYYRDTIGKFVGVLILLLILLLATSSIWFGYTERIQMKNQSSEMSGSMVSSRKDQWNFRIEEFKSSPVFGIGFATMQKGLINKNTGVIEPGSSWLAVFSMVGLMGGVPFLLLITTLFMTMWRARKRLIENSLLSSMLGFFIIHWFAEGYIFAAGAFLFFYSWLLIGVIDIHNNIDPADNSEMRIL
jgi:O-antigen ligase